MCGISGFFNVDLKKVESNYLNNFSQLLHHRGPDHTGKYYNEFIGLCHNRLSILDLSKRGEQPFFNERFYLVYNGEIYNYKEIKKELIKTDITFRSSSDTEVLFYALIHFGIEETLKKIKGMFAFAFFDSQEKKLFLARDRVGIKPLFYSIKNNTLFFSSEMKALTTQLSFELDEIRALHSVLGILEKSRHKTVFKNLYHIPPGSYAVFSKEGLKLNNYFKFSNLINENAYNKRNKVSFQENLEEFKHLFDQSVKRMLMSDAPMGAYVSGGIDSSLIALYASKYVSDDFKLFTANILGKYSEYDDAQLLAKSLSKELYDYVFKPEYFLRDLAKVTWHYESPVLVHSNSVAFSNVSNLAHKHQVKAVLTGEGADELFLGYPQLLTRRYNNLIKTPYRILDKVYGLFPTLKRYISGGASSGIDVLIEKGINNFTRELIREDGMDQLKFLPLKKQKEHYLTIQMLNEGIVSLLWRNDRMGMIDSIEARFPYLDEDILEFAVNLPIENKIGRTTKFYNYKHPFLIDKKIIRYSAFNKIPKRLTHKRKYGFPIFGLNYIKSKPDFFYNGFVNQLFGFNSKNQNKFFTDNFDHYHIAKFAALEVWGRLFVLNESIDQVSDHINKYLSMDH